jgi:hypothetical protein
VFQSTRCRVRDQINRLREDPQLPFPDLLRKDLVDEALRAERITFRDRIFTPSVTLWTFLSQVLSQDHSCREAVLRLIARLVASGQDPCAPRTNSYCEARERLPIGVIRRLARRTHDDLEQKVPQDWTWKGRHVCLVDGTTVSMPDTKANQRAFPQSQSQAPGLGFPIARVLALISLATGAVRDIAMGPYKGKETGETALLRSLLDRLGPGEILLGDRFFAGIFTFSLLMQRGVDGLFRMHQLRMHDFSRGRLLGVEDHVVPWRKPQRPAWLDQEIYDQIPDELIMRELRVRVHVPGPRVAELVLATTMLDPIAYPKDDLAALYLERWNVELDLRAIKSEMSMDILRCKTPEMVAKEVWAHLLAYNLVRGLMAAAAEASGKRPRQLSFKGAMQAIESFDAPLRLSRGLRRTDLLEALLHAIAAQEVGGRPGRVEPRAIKRRPKPHDLLRQPRAEARKQLLSMN